MARRHPSCAASWCGRGGGVECGLVADHGEAEFECCVGQVAVRRRSVEATAASRIGELAQVVEYVDAW
jgi:hypothetical protein